MRGSMGMVCAAAMLALGMAQGEARGAGFADGVLQAGADLRVRQEAFDEIPVKTGGVTRGGANDYIRARGRAWLGVKAERAEAVVRLADEVRGWFKGPGGWEWPDEAIVDQLALTLSLGEWGRVTAGRQDMKLGTGRLWADGTAKDGSRSSYFDGVRWHVEPGAWKIDLAGVYTEAENRLAIGHEHRDVTGYAGGFNGMDEGAVGVFAERQQEGGDGYGAYGVWKHDTAWRKADGERVEGEDIWTAGLRWMPRLGEKTSLEAEAALQWGDSDGRERFGTFAAGGLRHECGDSAWIGLGGLHMSGDDGDAGRRDDFNILFGRWPWISELMILAYDGVGTWNNLAMGWAEGGLRWGGKHELRGTAGPMWAEVADGAGGGHGRGWLGTARYEFPLWGTFEGHLLGEVLLPGDYYDSRSTSFFLRWEVSCRF